MSSLTQDVQPRLFTPMDRSSPGNLCRPDNLKLQNLLISLKSLVMRQSAAEQLMTFMLLFHAAFPDKKELGSSS